MIGAIQTGPHSFGFPIMAGAWMLLDNLTPAGIIEFNAPTGCGGPRVLAQVAAWMESATFICRRKEFGEAFKANVAAVRGREPHAFSFAYVALHLDEVLPLSPLVIFGPDIFWDGVVQSVAEEFAAKGATVIRVK